LESYLTQNYVYNSNEFYYDSLSGGFWILAGGFGMLVMLFYIKINTMAH
jgi:hypothetical protein